jgi:PAS domain S-box-containing protein
MYDNNLEKIKQVLKEKREGLTLTEVAEAVGVHRNSVAKYLDVLLTSGQVELRNIGRAKLFTLSNKIPLRELLNVTNTYNIIVNSENKILQHSSNATQLAKEEIVGKTLPQTSTLKKIIGNDKEVLEIKKKYYETRIIPLALRDGEPGRMIIIEDITGKREQEKQLLLLQRAVESSASGITIADMQAKDQPLIYINPAFEKITGYSIKEVKGKNCRFLQGEDTDEETKNAIRTTIKEGKEGRFEILNYKKDGKKFWNELYLSPVKDNKGKITHYVGVQSDVSYRH